MKTIYAILEVKKDSRINLISLINRWRWIQVYLFSEPQVCSSFPSLLSLRAEPKKRKVSKRETGFGVEKEIKEFRLEE